VTPRRLGAIGAAMAGVGILPLAIAIGAESVSKAFGCSVNEAGVSPCPVAGVDIGEPLAIAFVLGWAIIFTAPIFLGGILAMAVAGLIAITAALRKRT